MIITHATEKQFVEAVTDSNMLHLAIQWIKTYLSPEDVFNDDELAQWATDNGFVEEK